MKITFLTDEDQMFSIIQDEDQMFSIIQDEDQMFSIIQDEDQIFSIIHFKFPFLISFTVESPFSTSCRGISFVKLYN